MKPAPTTPKIPGHSLPRSAQCLERQQTMTEARKDLADKRTVYTAKINFVRFVVRVTAKEMHKLRSALATLRKEQLDLENMDATGTSRTQLKKARRRGLKDICKTVDRLCPKEKKLAGFEEDLEALLAATSLHRREIGTLTIALNTAIAKLEGCTKSEKPVTATMQPKDQIIPETPEDLPIEDNADLVIVDLPVATTGDLDSQSDLSREDIRTLLEPRPMFEATMNIDDFVSHLYQSLDMARFEPADNPNLVSIIRRDKEVIWTMFLDRKSNTVVPVPEPVPPAVMSGEYLGAEVVNGVSARKFHIVQAGVDGYQSDGLYWISPEGISVRTRVSEIRDGQPFNISIDLTDVSVHPIDPELFILTCGLSEMTFPTSGGFIKQ